MDVDGNMRMRVMPDTGFSATINIPEVPRIEVNIGRPDWTPHISFIQLPAKTLSYVVRMADDAVPADFDILLAGAAGSQLRLVWETWQWDYNTNSGGWNEAVDDAASPVVNLPGDNDPSNPFFATVIDPAKIDMRQHFQVSLPFNSAPPAGVRRQAMLYAIYEYQRPRPQGQSELIKIRSNPLLVTLFSQEAA
jgi:hypothetical protein